MTSRSLIVNLLNLSVFISVFYIIFKINYIFRDKEFFGSQVFLSDIIAPSASNALAQLLIFIIGSILVLFLYNKLIFSYKEKLEKLSKNQILKVVLGATLLIKLSILGFAFGHGDATIIIDNIFINGEFNSYKLYNYLALAIYALSDNYNFYLSAINIIFGCLTIGVLYLIFSKFSNSQSSLFLLIFLSILYIPITAIESVLRVDAMYILLITSTFYYLLKLVQENNSVDFIKLLIIIVLSCFCRESTLYMLPLFIFILFFSKENKIKYIFTMSLTVLVISMLISASNLKNYGIKSKYKEFHLIYHAMHYGYLNPKYIKVYENSISANAKDLLEDINASYKSNVPPHKRENFEPNFKGYYTSRLLAPIFHIVRPDVENISMKSRVTPYKGNLEIIVNNYSSILSNLDSLTTKRELYDLMTKQSLTYVNQDDKNLSKYIKALVLETYLADRNKLYGNLGICATDKSIKSNMVYETSCVLSVINDIDHQWMMNKSDPAMYSKAILPFTWTQDQETKKYMQHENIKYITEIILEMPMLYIVQSFLTLTSMSGSSPVPSGLIEMHDIYDKSFLPSFVLVNFQNIYTFIINFWYIFCILILLHSLFSRDINSRNFKIIISLIPLYYISFICFAAQGEFARHIAPMAPFIIYNYILVINILYLSGKEIIFVFQSKK